MLQAKRERSADVQADVVAHLEAAQSLALVSKQTGKLRQFSPVFELQNRADDAQCQGQIADQFYDFIGGFRLSRDAIFAEQFLEQLARIPLRQRRKVNSSEIRNAKQRG